MFYINIKDVYYRNRNKEAFNVTIENYKWNKKNQTILLTRDKKDEQKLTTFQIIILKTEY